MEAKQHHHGHHATAARPTLSLLRLSAWQRVIGSGAILAVLWLLVLSVLT
jgi:hypothetical protein